MGGARLLTLLISAIVLLFVDVGSRVLMTNDEARFPLFARHILEGVSRIPWR